MSKSRQPWTEAEVEYLKQVISASPKPNIHRISQKLRRSAASVDSKIHHLIREGKVQAATPIPVSTMPKYDKPLQSEGDAVILTDVEAPFHHSDFINRVLELADHWGVKTLHLDGDLLHFDSLSAWGAEWIPDEEEANMQNLLNFIQKLPQKLRDEGNSILEKAGAFGGSGDLADELAEARAVFRSFTMFDDILVALGNHDDRYLRALDRAIKPKELLVQLDRHHDKRWKIAPYYYTFLETSQGLYRIEHPRGSSRSAAQDLAVQYHCHIVMGHSHRWAVNRDPSGKFWAIQTGHCVDETRLAYVMQRSAKRDAHCLGATIIRDGHPWVLGEWTPWDRMKRM